MARYVDQGFVLADGLTWRNFPQTFGSGEILVEGTILCASGVRVEVTKTLQILDGAGQTAIVQTVAYSYSAVLTGTGNIFRYCSPHPDDEAPHHPHHHVHRFNVLADDDRGTIDLVGDDEDWPTLGEVLGELRGWCADNAERLAAL